MILCADCEADLTFVTGTLSNSTSACPFCGHQVFEEYSFEGRFGPGTEAE